MCVLGEGYLWSSENNLQKSVFSSYRMGSKNEHSGQKTWQLETLPTELSSPHLNESYRSSSFVVLKRFIRNKKSQEILRIGRILSTVLFCFVLQLINFGF